MSSSTTLIRGTRQRGPRRPTAPPARRSPPGRARPVWAITCGAAVVPAAWATIDDPLMSRAAMVAGVCLVLWLSEAIPLFATTLLLWVETILLLAPLDPPAFGTARVLAAVTNPVMVLFFGGFLLPIAGAKYGIDACIASWMIRASGGRRRVLLATVMGVTACLSMWMLNTAAATMMVAALGALLHGGNDDGADRLFRAALLLGLALAANFGGMATPIGTGPNLIAIGAVAPVRRIVFLDWMSFALPLSVAMTAFAYVVLIAIHRVSGVFRPAPIARRPLGPRGWCSRRSRRSAVVGHRVIAAFQV